MSVGAFDVQGELRALIGDGRVSIETLCSVTGIARPSLERYLGDTEGRYAAGPAAGPPLFSHDEALRLSVVTNQLVQVMSIDDDERLTAILETLVAVCGLTPENIARLTGVWVQDIEAALRDVTSLPIERRYQIGMRASYLISVVNAAQPRR